MATFYEDETRKSVFAERASQAGPRKSVDKCPIDLLEWSPGDTTTAQQIIPTNAQALSTRARPRVQIVFAPLDYAYHELAAGIQDLYKIYSIPSDFISQRLESVTHSFNSTYEGSTYTSWFHFLCKHFTVHDDSGLHSQMASPHEIGLSHGDWSWIRTSVFMRWSECHDKGKASVVLIIFSASLELRNRCERLCNQDISAALVDPFSLFVICLDELWLQALGIVNVVGDEFSKMERTALDLARSNNTGRDVGRQDFVGLHNMAKHIIHLKEGSDATSLTISHLQKFHKELLKEPPQGQVDTPTMRLTGQMLAQKAVQFEVWKLRMSSLQQRMQNVINLSFNVVTQQDSQILKKDSKSMKRIATVTMLFLPLATIAAIFGSQFFNFDTQSKKILVAHDFWIFWVLFVGLSIAVWLLYQFVDQPRDTDWEKLSKVFKLE